MFSHLVRIQPMIAQLSERKPRRVRIVGPVIFYKITERSGKRKVSSNWFIYVTKNKKISYKALMLNDFMWQIRRKYSFFWRHARGHVEAAHHRPADALNPDRGVRRNRMTKKITMKKLLLITSILASTAGVAAADISVSGDARMGVISTDGGKNFTFSSRARVRFTASGETDDGLKFGAVVRANESVDAATTGALGTVFIESPTLGKLTFGDADGAAQAAVTQFAPIGFDDTGKLQEFRFLTGGSTGKARDALYTYTNGKFAFSISAGDPGATNAVPSNNFSNDRAIGVAYTTEFWKLAAGYEDDGVNTQSIVSGSYGNGQVEVKAAYGQRGDKADQFEVYGTYILSVNTFTAFYRKDFKDVNYKGIGISRDLGGGMALSAGYIKPDNAKALISVGALMSF